MVAAILFGLGIAGSGLAIKLASLPLLYLSYGVLGGIGLGIGYLTPVSALLKWFPDKRGLASGLAIMGFGFAALISGPLIVKLIGSVGIANTFYITGSAYFALIFASSRYITAPPQGWTPDGMSEPSETKKTIEINQLTAKEAIKTKCFWYLWIMFFINISCGITVISLASPMAQEVADLSAIAAAAMVGFMRLFNGGGRIGWAAFSDAIGRPNTFILFFCLQILIYIFLLDLHNAIIFQCAIFLIISCYGAGFSTVPAFIADMFVQRAWSNSGIYANCMGPPQEWPDHYLQPR